jgi:hypothetical protein
LRIEKLVETVDTAAIVLEGMRSEVAHLETVESRITDASKESVKFNWIRLTGCSLHYQRLEDEIVRGVTRISVPWWCKRKNESLGETTRQMSLKRKLQVVSHQQVSMKIMTLDFYCLVRGLCGLCLESW